MAEPATAAPASPRKATFDRSQQHRRSMYAKAQIAKKQLAMDEDDYRQLIFDEAGTFSLTQCSDAQLEKVLNRLKGLGFKPLPKAGAARPAMHPMARKARALWISLYHLGAVRNSSEQALEAFARRQLGCERMEWARQSDAFRLIEALKAMATRHGWHQRAVDGGRALSVQTLNTHLCEVILAKLKDAGKIPQDWSLDVALFRLCGVDTGEIAAIGPEFYQQLAAMLGAKLREFGLAETEQ
ncbi:regulatory protein GemA [Allopontixanthobacter sp.]|uniref:gp16 family protein n=1 Tax=Allopontixanthobacter sp. TaxID=2906452 RepID=UPI002ABA7A0D|nr:regulatory protein GemA [Allopontixanthobacter sp.]MDZ4308400.1 regulatory protein GemA [Allopontixanthobacter sp.]